jgi:putative transposase
VAGHDLFMPRIPRLSVAGVSLHIVQRGNNRQAVFFHDADCIAWLDALFESALRYDVSIHAWVCMTNHVHLLVTPWDEGAASRMMQRLGSTYTTGINATYRRSGSLWEGRFKSSLVDSERYVLACYRYIELNPVRAGIVSHPSGYRWSSYRQNAISLDDYPIQPHVEWLALGANAGERRVQYRCLVDEGVSQKQLESIRYATRKGVPTGSDRFKSEIESALARRIGNGRRGRPKNRERSSRASEKRALTPLK